MTSAFGILERVEVRALLPLWGAATGFVVFAALSGIEAFHEIAVFVYAFGSLALGAHAIGHDHMHGTLPLVLAQPVARTRVFLVKMIVLAFYLTLLAGAALFLVWETSKQTDPDIVPWMIGFIWASSLLLAPLHAMLTRTTIGGAVFAIVVPATIWLAGGLLALWRFNVHSAVSELQARVFWTAMPIVWPMAGVAAWWMFARLQLLDGQSRQLHLPAVRRAHGLTRRVRGPFASLLLKELRLQGLAVAVVGIYVAVALGVWGYHQFNPTYETEVLVPITVLYAGLLAMVIGATGSAEERQLGTRDTQLLLPIPVWQQWVIKSGVVMGSSLTLAVLLPIAVTAVVLQQPASEMPDLLPYLVVIVLLTATTLYVSTLSSNTVQALVLSVPLIIAAVWLFHLLAGRHLSFRIWSVEAALLVTTGAVATTLLSLGQRNHRRPDVGLSAVLQQTPMLAGVLVAAIALLALFV